MKNLRSLFILIFSILFSLSASLQAQEETEITIKVKKDGKVVKDTTYSYTDHDKAGHGVKMMEIMSDEGDHSRSMVVVSEDGETTTIKKVHCDSLVWISEEDQEGEVIKVIRIKTGEGDHPHGEHVMIMKSGDCSTFDILIDEEVKVDKGKEKKHVKVMVSDDESGTWHVDGEELKEVDEDVYVISGDDDVKVELQKILEEHGEGEDVKVVVVKKKTKKQ